jgi:hypothetical protein
MRCAVLLCTTMVISVLFVGLTGCSGRSEAHTSGKTIYYQGAMRKASQPGATRQRIRHLTPLH